MLPRLLPAIFRRGLHLSSPTRVTLVGGFFSSTLHGTRESLLLSDLLKPRDSVTAGLSWYSQQAASRHLQQGQQQLGRANRLKGSSGTALTLKETAR